MELSGKIAVIGAAEQITDSFTKRNCVVTTDEQYPQTIAVEFVQDKIALLDKFKVGDDVEIGINIRGREWKSPKGDIKYFTSIQGWRIAFQSTNDNTTGVDESPQKPSPNEDDLPF